MGKKQRYKLIIGSAAYDKQSPLFSFKDFEDSEYYTKEDATREKDSLLNFFKAAKGFCGLTWEEIKRAKQFHAHKVIEDIPELKEIQVELFQFKLPNHDKGRFIGYIENGIFYMLIYDRNHKVNKRK